MTRYKRQDIVLVEFGFSEDTGTKKRPVLIISSDQYHKSLQEVIIAAITSNVERVLFGDTKIIKWKDAGLIYPSLVTTVIRTIKDDMIIHRLGVLSQPDFNKVVENFKSVFGF